MYAKYSVSRRSAETVSFFGVHQKVRKIEEIICLFDGVSRDGISSLRREEMSLRDASLCVTASLIGSSFDLKSKSSHFSLANSPRHGPADISGHI